MSTAHGSTGTAEKSLNQKVGLAFGVIYILVGLLGFLLAGGTDFIGQEGNKLLGIFEVNGLHNIVHILIGVALAGAAMSSHAASRSTNMAVGVVYLLLGLLGWFIDDTALDIVALNPADHILHLLSGILLIAVARGVGDNTSARTV